MADKTQDKGFSIPTPSNDKTQQANSDTPTSATTSSTQIPGGLNEPNVVVTDVQPRDYLIAGGILFILIIAFFFAKTAYSNYLAKKRVPTGSANAAGWWLFIFMTGLASAAVLSILSPIKFMNIIFMGPLLLVSLVALVLMFVTGRRS